MFWNFPKRKLLKWSFRFFSSKWLLFKTIVLKFFQTTTFQNDIWFKPSVHPCTDYNICLKIQLKRLQYDWTFSCKRLQYDWKPNKLEYEWTFSCKRLQYHWKPNKLEYEWTFSCKRLQYHWKTTNYNITENTTAVNYNNLTENTIAEGYNITEKQ